MDSLDHIVYHISRTYSQPAIMSRILRHRANTGLGRNTAKQRPSSPRKFAMTSVPLDIPILPSPNDLNFLAVVLRGLEQANKYASKRTDSPSNTKLDRQYRVLDSLAYALVSVKEKQVVAIGVMVSGPVPSDDSRVQPSLPALKNVVLVSQIFIPKNRDVGKEAQQHMEDIFTRLRSICSKFKALIGQGSPQGVTPDLIPPEAKEPYYQEVAELELRMIEYSWKKFGRRFTKSG